MKKILIGCEESQTICRAFRDSGYEAFSNDIIDCSGGYPEWHLKMDVFEALKLEKWDLIILHPPCTALAVSGNGTYGIGKEKISTQIRCYYLDTKLWNKATLICNKVCMENPVGVLNTMGNFPKPQYIQPWQFGHGETKKTGLWLQNLPNLISTNIVEGREQKVWKMPPSKDRTKLRSKTYKGIAEAIVSQWGPLL